MRVMRNYLLLGVGAASMTAWALRVHSAPSIDLDSPIYSLQMHIHGSLSEGRGRMINHAERNRELGIDVLWWSDHGGMTNPMMESELRAMSFDFEAGALFIPRTGQVPPHGFVPMGPLDFATASLIDTTAAAGNFCMAIEAMDGAVPDSARFDGHEYLLDSHHAVRSFFQDIEVRFSARLLEPPVPGRTFGVECALSKDLDGRTMRIVFLSTDCPLPEDEAHVAYARMPLLSTEGWTQITLPVSDIGRQRFAYGRDLGYHEANLGWRVTEDGYSGVLIDDYMWDISGLERDDLLSTQQSFLDSLPEAEPLHLVGYETAGSRLVLGGINPHHINVFARNGIPKLPDYTHPRYDPEEFPANLVSWAHGHGYVLSYNHLFGPFESISYHSEATRDSIRDALVAADGYGCDLLEVGYDQRGRPIEDHVNAWDRLLQNDAFLTGTGVSDHHETRPWYGSKNRFVTWVRPQKLGPRQLLNELQRGRAAFGDPHIVGGEAFVALLDPIRRFEMGDIVLTEWTEAEIRVVGEFDGAEMSLALITVHAGHNDTTTVGVTGPERFNSILPVEISDRCHVRVELYDPLLGKPRLFSNPIHFRREAPAAGRPGTARRRIVDLRLAGRSGPPHAPGSGDSFAVTRP